jgi:molecular chaperone GrpE
MSEEQRNTPVNGTHDEAPTEEQANIPAGEAQTQEDATGEQHTLNGALAQEVAADGGGEPAPQPAVDELQARVKRLEKETEDYRDKWLRATADYKNFKRRTEQERSDLIRGASAGLLLKLLPVLDDMERAFGGVPADIAASSWFEGFKLIVQKLQTILESEGVTPIQALGQEFDPNLHEAVIYDESGDGTESKVVAELQKGYKLRDRVLRPTMVKVGKG